MQIIVTGIWHTEFHVGSVILVSYNLYYNQSTNFYDATVILLRASADGSPISNSEIQSDATVPFDKRHRFLR